MKRSHHNAGFTLVELLVTITIIIILVATTFVGVQCVRDRSKAAVEVGAAKNLIAGYLTYAADHNGALLPGYKSDPDATNLEGKLVGSPPNARYPWRLIPSVPVVKGVMFYNGNESHLQDKDADYKVSVWPNMGINAIFVGGSYGSDGPLDASSERVNQLLGNYFVSNLAQADDPSKLIVFGSARHPESSGENGQGYYKVEAPNMTGRNWSSGAWKEDGQPKDHGYIDLRNSGKAVVAMLGGNVEVLDEKQLRDMRRWSNQAIRDNNPDFILTPSR